MKILFWLLAFIFTLWLSFAQVYISEVFYAGSDEWIELFSPNWYSWDVSILWAKSSEIKANVSISAWWIIILADEWNNILDKSIIQKSWIWFSLTDSNPINIVLKTSDFSHSFSIDPNNFPKQSIKTSFSYDFVDSQPKAISQTNIFSNSNENASPWKIQVQPVLISSSEISSSSQSSQDLSSLSSEISSFSSDIQSSISSEGSSFSSEETISSSSSYENSSNWVFSSENDSSSSSEVSQISSSHIWSSISSSIISSSENFSSIENNIIFISEINPTNHFYPEYIEIFANQWYSWSLYLSWAGKAQKTFDANLKQWEFYIITDSAIWFLSQNLIIVPWIVLNDKQWNIKLFSSSFWDEKTYSWTTNYKSWSFTNPSWLINQTPWFDNKFEKYIKPISSSLSCGVKIQNSKSFYAWDSINLIAVLDWKEMQNSSSETCSWLVDWRPIFWQCNPSYSTNFVAWINMINLTISTQDGQSCQTFVYLNLPLKSEISQKILSTSSQSSQTNISSPYALACYNPQVFDISQVKIFSVLPNPKWKDDKEIITLVSSWSLNISWYYLQVGSKKTILSWNIDHELKLEWSFWMKNTYGCSYLYNDKKFIVSQFCRNDPKEDETMLTSYQPLEQVPMFLWKDFWFEDWCFKFKDSEIFCDKNINIDDTKYEKLKAKYDELSQKLKDQKAESKKKYDALNDKYKKYKSDAKIKYEKLKQKYDNYKKSQKEKYDKLNQKYKTQKQKDKQKYDKLNEKYKKFKDDTKQKTAKLKADAKEKYDWVVLKWKKKIEAEKKLQATNKDLREKNSNLKALHDFDISFFNYLKKAENEYTKDDFSLYSLGQKSIWSWVIINWIKYNIKNFQQLQEAKNLNLSKDQVDEKIKVLKQILN